MTEEVNVVGVEYNDDPHGISTSHISLLSLKLHDKYCPPSEMNFNARILKKKHYVMGLQKSRVK